MSRFAPEHRLAWILGPSAAFSALLVVFILVHLLVESSDALLQLGPRLLRDGSWQPAETAGEGSFGLGPMVAATAAVTLGATLIGAPLGLSAALLSRYYAPPALGRPMLAIIELLAGIPSVVYGFWGLTVLAPLIGRWHPPGPGLLTGILVLALMILPTIALFSESAFQAVGPASYRAAAALGMGRWGTLRAAVFPRAFPALVAGVILGIGRALGETMAVLMVCGNIVRVPGSLLDPVRTLTANIGLEMGYAVGVHRSALFASGLLLLVVVSGLMLGAEAVSASRRRKTG